MAGFRRRVSALTKAVVTPAGFRERRKLAVDIGAEQRDDLVDALRSERAVAGVFQLACETSTEEAGDAGPAGGTQVKTADASTQRCAAQPDIRRPLVGI